MTITDTGIRTDNILCAITGASADAITTTAEMEPLYVCSWINLGNMIGVHAAELDGFIDLMIYDMVEGEIAFTAKASTGNLEPLVAQGAAALDVLKSELA